MCATSQRSKVGSLMKRKRRWDSGPLRRVGAFYSSQSGNPVFIHLVFWRVSERKEPLVVAACMELAGGERCCLRKARCGNSLCFIHSDFQAPIACHSTPHFVVLFHGMALLMKSRAN